MSEHALLNPSASERWLACTPSVRLSEKLPRKSSAYADQGSIAHDLAAIYLRHRFEKVPLFDTLRQRSQVKSSEYYNEEMEHHVTQYKQYCFDKYDAMKRRKRSVTPFVETRFDVSSFIPEGFGTSDFNLAADGLLEVIDFKYGEGVPVSAENNSQMKIYALGVLELIKWLYRLDKVRMTIHQPRIDNIDTWEMQVDDLYQWAHDELMPRAKLAFDGKGDFNPGSHCRFCPAKTTCRALRDHHMEVAKYEFALPELLQPEEISEILTQAKDFKNWINAVETYALELAKKNPTMWPGFKVVEGRSNRVIKDPQAAFHYLRKMGYPAHEISTVELRPLGALEKVLAQGEFNSLLQRFVVKPKGAPTLVPVTHKKPAIGSAQDAENDFKHLNLD